MLNVRVSIDLPYLLLLPSGEYPTAAEGRSVQIAESFSAVLAGVREPKTVVSMLFSTDDKAGTEKIARLRHREADGLLRRVNSLLRWYRIATGQATIVELTRAQASPFRFTVEKSGVAWGDDGPLEYEPKPILSPSAPDRAVLGEAVRQGLSGDAAPDVAALNLLDAEYALSVGRFREAVLLCWGAIDSTFVRKFKTLVDTHLTNESADGRDFLKGLDFGLRYKMTIGLRLLVNRSLYTEPDKLWENISASYSLRNRIIHEGQIAHEDDAEQAIKVTRKIVEIAASLS